MTPAVPSSTTAPAVSVIIPAYNAARTIDTALQSVFAQTFRDIEVIVVDDGSLDDTAERVATWGSRVVFQQQPNNGPAAARNRGIQLARGGLLAFLDADDLWLPTKLERQVAYFDRYPETGLLHAEALTSRASVAQLLEGTDDADPVAAPPTNDFCALFHCDRYVKTLTVMAPRHVVAGVGGFEERREFHVEDWDLWLRIAARHPVGYLPATLAVHRPDGGMSSNVEKTFRGQTLVIEKVLPLCATACPRHRENPARCITTRQHLLHSQLGYERFWRGHRRTAREAYKQALSSEPADSRARCYVVATYLGRWSLEPVRDLAQLIRGLRGRRQALARPPAPARDLLQDTIFRRARASAKRIIHAADDFLAHVGNGPRRVLFEAASPLSMAVFAPVYRRLRDDARVELWFTATDEAWEARRIFEKAGITERILTREQVRWQKFDLYINTDFWNMTWLPRRTRRMHMFHGVAGKYGLDAPTSIAPLISTFDRLLFANLDRLKRYAAAGLVDPESPRAALVGYPKVDCLVDGTLDRGGIMGRLGLDAHTPTVLYAPTWSPHSSLNEVGEDVIRSLTSLGVNVVVKLHDRSLDRTERGSGGVDWRARLAGLCRERRAHLAEGSDASPYLFIADALVTDHSSVGFEYTLLDRPVVVLDTPELLKHSRVNPQKAQLLQSGSHVVRDVDGLGATVRHALDHPALLSSRRRQIAGELFYRPGTATERAVHSIYQLLRLPALAPATFPGTAPAPVQMTPLEMEARQS